MEKLSWDEYYEKYYDLADSSKEKYLSYLKDVGPGDEAAEIILDLSFDNEKGAKKLLKEANKAKTVFASEDIMNFALFADDDTIKEAALNSSQSFTKKDLEDLCDILDEDTVVEISKKEKLPLPSFYSYLNEDEDNFEDGLIEKQPKKPGFFTSLMMSVGLISIYDHIKEKYFDDK